ncbi:MAG TPA: hypothetical protein VMM60_00195 [Ilumatobacter sp.]|nr:hypothetical protein [Ilumatobacter sp.]
METNDRMIRPSWINRGATVITLCLAVGACGVLGNDETTTVESTITPTSAATTVPPTTAPAPPATGLIESAPATLETAPISTATTVVAAPVETLPIVISTTVPTEPTVPPTTEPLAIQELQLTADGIGSAIFGASPDGVIEYVTSILGGNTGDTGWVDPFDFAACDGTQARRVDWGVLSLLFGDVSIYSAGRDHFIGWEYGRVGEIGDEPVGLRTPSGLTLGGRVVDLVAEFPEVSLNDGDAELDIPSNFYVSDSFYGLLSGVGSDDFVTVMFGGYGCGN